VVFGSFNREAPVLAGHNASLKYSLRGIVSVRAPPRASAPEGAPPPRPAHARDRPVHRVRHWASTDPLNQKDAIPSRIAMSRYLARVAGTILLAG
jgi:hypothetical protein